VSVEKDQGNK